MGSGSEDSPSESEQSFKERRARTFQELLSAASGDSHRNMDQEHRSSQPEPSQTDDGPLIGVLEQTHTSVSQHQHIQSSLHRQSLSSPHTTRMKLRLAPIPPGWGTWDFHSLLEHHGNIVRIDVHKSTGCAIICFCPPPTNLQWLGPRLDYNLDGNVRRHLSCSYRFEDPLVYQSPTSQRQFLEHMSVPLLQIEFGVQQAESSILILRSSAPERTGISNVTLNLPRKWMDIHFTTQHPSQEPRTRHVTSTSWRFRSNFAQMRQLAYVSEADGSCSLVLTVDYPPFAFRRTSDTKATHGRSLNRWDETTMWRRQTEIHTKLDSMNTPIQLQPQDSFIDIGRWLTYRLRFTRQTVLSSFFKHFCQALTDHNISIIPQDQMTFVVGDPNELWSCGNTSRGGLGNGISSSAGLHEMAGETQHLPFPVQYQLEVCLSAGVLHECNFSAGFLARLSALDTQRAVTLLEKVVDSRERYYDPNDIFQLEHTIDMTLKKVPNFCTKILSVTVTPTTLYFATPVLETSNRVIRQFKHHENRFLRVKFIDERYWGRLRSPGDGSMDEVFSRITRTLTHGIHVGDRHYEFLAFGNSQFREHGAYFFSSTSSLSAADIRKWMGNFTSIRVIAKYASRLGQCFSTTRAIGQTATIERIPDVERNGFCFTDGVGKISPFLAQMIGLHFGLDTPNTPSVFQFRLAGLKGILAVDPALKGRTIQVRPSQEKFPATYYGLEICRISQFSTAYLNMQLILVLSALGVPNEAFLIKMRAVLRDMEEAMTNERKAQILLQRHIDSNQMTLILASMIRDGFMQTKDPFTISCLRLWRSWNLKYLKEKARIYIDQGAFVLGTTDETGVLRGHFDEKDRNGITQKSQLPEIFLQIPDAEGKGIYRVVEGICALARNPSLHPGDIRIVQAVDVASLRHLKNCVVLPQTGDRDLANMCSGGDLDGDDYLVMWDDQIMPLEWNHEPMDFTSPTPELSEGPVTVQDLTNFFVNHIKNDNLARIATAHRYWADRLPDGVKDERCLELAELHSKAVDYAKTGVPAEMPGRLRIDRWPHWSEAKNKARIYQSESVLGKLYDEVQRVPFQPAWDLPFDDRILASCEIDEPMLLAASAVKRLYDQAVRRIMAQFGIKSEFEVFTTFVLEHHSEIGDYKFSEVMGEVATTLRQRHQELCYEEAGTSSKERDWTKLKPFVIAMYVVTSNEVRAAMAETAESDEVDGRDMPRRARNIETMPFMSFPWIFSRELGLIASGRDDAGRMQSDLTVTRKPKLSQKSSVATKHLIDLLGPEVSIPALPLPEVKTQDGLVQFEEGDLLDLYHGEGGEIATKPLQGPVTMDADLSTPTATPSELSSARTPGLDNVRDTIATDRAIPSKDKASLLDIPQVKAVMTSHNVGTTSLLSSESKELQAQHGSKNRLDLSDQSDLQNGGEDEIDEEEPVEVFFDTKPSALDRLVDLVGAD